MIVFGMALFGGLGAVSRFILTISIQRWWKRPFPLATTFINLVACLCAGIAAGAYAHSAVNHETYLLFVTGFLGGFSTFSTAVNELAGLIKSRNWLVACQYAIVNVLVPLLCVFLGWLLGSLGK